MARIAVVDDRVTNRNILTRLAASVEEGLAVSAFPGPVEALDAFDAGSSPDLIITDFNMPDMDGASFVRALRSRPALVDVPVIVITVYQDREFCYRALEAGATDFLLSPVDHLEFRARARNLLTLRRQQLLLAERAADLERELHTRHDGTEQEVLQRVLDAMPAAVSVVDARGRLVVVNQRLRASARHRPRHRAGAAAPGKPRRGVCAAERRARRQGAARPAWPWPRPYYDTLDQRRRHALAADHQGTAWAAARAGPPRC